MTETVRCWNDEVFGRTLRVLAALLLIPLLVVPGQFARAQDDVQTFDERVYQLGVGDRLRVTVFNEVDLSGEFDVGPAGTVNLPLIGEVVAQGRTIPEVEQAAEELFLQGYLKAPSVSIEVLNYRPFYILGEVNSPGSYPFVNGMTVLNAVALAGGFTYRASEDSVLLKREGTASEVSVAVDTPVLPGDVLTVEERFF